MSKLIDGGKRTEFDTGAVREPTDGKGRCDLLLLNEIAQYYSMLGEELIASIFGDIAEFVYTQKVSRLYAALYSFSVYLNKNIEELWLMNALQMEDGAKKYAERNWENGIPTARYIDSAVRHLLKFLIHEQKPEEWNDEPHDRAFIWNILCAAWNMNHRPDLNNLPLSLKDKE